MYKTTIYLIFTFLITPLKSIAALGEDPALGVARPALNSPSRMPHKVSVASTESDEGYDTVLQRHPSNITDDDSSQARDSQDFYIPETPSASQNDFYIPETPAASQDLYIPETPFASQQPPIQEERQIIEDVVETWQLGAHIYSDQEQAFLQNSHNLSVRKRWFKRHLLAYFKKNIAPVIGQPLATRYANRLVRNIKDAKDDYFKIKKRFLTILRKKGVEHSVIKTLDKTLMIPHEQACKEFVQGCAAAAKAFKHLPSFKEIAGREKLLPDLMLRQGLMEIQRELEWN